MRAPTADPLRYGRPEIHASTEEAQKAEQAWRAERGCRRHAAQPAARQVASRRRPQAPGRLHEWTPQCHTV
ncbi:hypothetical protein TRIP_B210020 [uncultured Desulfatiglans sp.]|uniref:Uncharacterized protein n=1 Tax=Uncultured Desulfatiglans sp. TaxID=1748965 RepID=A0A653A424_UNCDX|nr:hypothetical protein TRIP_B210020 [uncultured Desulfatiglans sp.]